MLAGSHVALGAAAWVVAAPRLGLPALNPASLALAVLGGLLPDIDHPKSWAGQRIRPVSNVIGAVFGHRGITHSLLAVAACCLLLLRADLPRAWVAPVVVGYLSHLAADLLTPGGLRLAWPLKGTYALPLCRTGSPFEPLVVALIVAWAGCGVANTGALRADWNGLGLCRLWEGSDSRCAAPAAAAARAPDRPRPQLTNRVPPDAPRGARS